LAKKEKKEIIEKKEKKYISIRTFLTICIVSLIVFSLFGFFLGIMYFYGRRSSVELLNTTENRTKYLVDELQKSDMVIDTPLLSYIEEAAYLSEGRIMVISDRYQIMTDTRKLQDGNYIVHEDVMDVMAGRKANIRVIRNKFAEIILPVKNEEGRIRGVVVFTSSTRSISSRYQYLLRRALVIFGILMLVDFILLNIITRKSVRGVQDMSRQLNKVAKGHVLEKAPEKGFREMRQLTKNYNAMVDVLQSVDSSRQEFVSNVSHELKTPITSMKVLSEALLQNENTTVEEFRDFMTDIVSEVDRETDIINDLLTLVKTDRQDPVMNYSEVNIGELLEAVIKTVTPLAARRNIEISYESYRDVVADVDQVKLTLAVSNIIENAVKYNVDSGWIKVSLNSDHRFFYIKVADSGVGIPDDAKDKVFDRFYRVDKARSRDTGGTGLGLSITRSIIHSHNGTIRLYSESGQGTTFSLRIPLKKEESV